MVEDRITDGKRIAQFLASELNGMQTGTLARVDVIEADRDAEPAPDGEQAYRIAYADDTIASVVMFPESAEVRLLEGSWESPSRATDVTIDGSVLTVRSVASVKQAVDTLRSTLESSGNR